MGMSLKNNRGRGGRNFAPMAEINVTPMVDVMLVLLIIFMVTSPMMIAGVTVDLPKTSSPAIAGQDEPLSVTIDGKGNIYIQNKQIEAKDLVAKLKAVTKQKRDTRIFVRGDKNIDYGKVMNLVGQINAAGFTKVALLTEISGG